MFSRLPHVQNLIDARSALGCALGLEGLSARQQRGGLHRTIVRSGWLLQDDGRMARANEAKILRRAIGSRQGRPDRCSSWHSRLRARLRVKARVGPPLCCPASSARRRWVTHSHGGRGWGGRLCPGLGRGHGEHRDGKAGGGHDGLAWVNRTTSASGGTWRLTTFVWMRAADPRHWPACSSPGASDVGSIAHPPHRRPCHRYRGELVVQGAVCIPCAISGGCPRTLQLLCAFAGGLRSLAGLQCCAVFARGLFFSCLERLLSPLGQASEPLGSRLCSLEVRSLGGCLGQVHATEGLPRWMSRRHRSSRW